MAADFIEFTELPDTTVRPMLRANEIHECGAVVRGAPPLRTRRNLR